ncbi:endonuclease V [Halostagnicola sp. A-GB9-2]|uniref:endonuclease V n=1 Tax=Halostagnicola sp. A-GB9-2 TaxID=3048066 RepID=UPI0024C08194|nr:endonuclease V [Halostagnicola sp. A-GB9-2]MDJ1431693.1 endonuclease V [Halostagnicola sp. A-GB9-2]
MTQLSRPDLLPDASLSTEDMESLQREIASSAVFKDDIDIGSAPKGETETGGGSEFDPATLSNPLQAASRDTEPPIVAGVDQSFLLEDEPERALSAVVAMQGGEVIERVHAVTPLEIPYIPGLLAFREGAPILDAIEELSVEPDLFLFDGSGRIHFRQAGIATHIGVILDIPAIGVAKSLLCGEPADDLENLPAGTRVPIEANSRVDTADGTVLGYAVQTKQYESSSRYVNPLYVSPGHRVGPKTAAEVVLELSSGYKLPEPVRLADSYADEAKTIDG